MKHYPGIAEYKLSEGVYEHLLDRVLKTNMKNHAIEWRGSEQYKGLCFNHSSRLYTDARYQYAQYFESEVIRYDNSFAFYEYNLFGDSLSKIKPFIRSKYSLLKHDKSFIGSWHTDESPEEIIRILIPIHIDNNYNFQQEGMNKFNFKTGYAYHFDTRIPHRVTYNGNSTNDRECLVLAMDARDIQKHPLDFIKNLSWID